MELNKAELLSEISPDMKLNWDFFKRIYCYGVTDSAFPEQALSALEAAGCCHARAYYERYVQQFEAEQEAIFKRVGAWVRARKDGWFRSPATRNLREQIIDLSSEELTELCARLLREGIISDPEELVEFVDMEGG